MSKPFFSASWYRIAALRPRLRSHVQLHRHHYRGQLWYVLQNHASQSYHRFSPAAYSLIGLMDGQRSIQEIWERAGANLGDDAPTQDELIQLLTNLYAADALQSDVPPDVTAMLLSHDRQRRHRWQSQLLNPLYWRFPLFDPESVLQRLLRFAESLFSRAGAALWLALVSAAVALAAMHWDELTHNITDRVLTPQNLFLLWLLFPLVKILHEFGHACATRLYGGEVHEMGVLLLVLQPVPYVDASSASALRSKWQRMIVGAAGMLVELFIAALAFFVWLNIEPGAVRAVAYNIMLIAGISTVLFNANPLLRYDGYYILADYLEIPNLSARSQTYLGYLCERYLFGRREAASDTETSTERVWLIVYGIAAFIYRLFVLLAIAMFIAGKFFFIGVMLAVSGVIVALIIPTAKILSNIFTGPRLRNVRQRAITVTAALVVVIVGLISWVPLPLRTRAEGVVWIPEQGHVRAGADGFIDQIVAQPGARVRRGDVLMICSDPQLATRVKVLESRLEELQTRYTAQWLEDHGQAEIIKDEIAHVEESLTRARERVAELVIRSRTDGTFVVPQAEDLPGRFFPQGSPLAYVLDFTALTARVVVSQREIDLVRQRSRRIDVRLIDHPAQPLHAVIMREVPAATEQLPSTALGSQGGGSIAVDPVDKQGVKAIDKLFHLELGLPSSAGISVMGGRVYVRFDHGWEPLVYRWHRQVRQLFLSKFYV
jgi:putative peptide zinc metalloprotease protein